MFVRVLRFNLHPDIDEATFLAWDRSAMVPVLAEHGLLEYRVLIAQAAAATHRYQVMHVWPDKAAFQRFGATGRIKGIFETLARQVPSIEVDGKVFARLFPDFAADEYEQTFRYDRPTS